jgi:hypothetical protein
MPEDPKSSFNADELNALEALSQKIKTGEVTDNPDKEKVKTLAKKVIEVAVEIMDEHGWSHEPKPGNFANNFFSVDDWQPLALQETAESGRTFTDMARHDYENHPLVLRVDLGCDELANMSWLQGEPYWKEIHGLALKFANKLGFLDKPEIDEDNPRIQKQDSSHTKIQHPSDDFTLVLQGKPINKTFLASAFAVVQNQTHYKIPPQGLK